MPTIDYRWDYAKLLVTHPVGSFQSYYRVICDAAKPFVKDQLSWDRSHKVMPWRSNHDGLASTLVEVWGEAAELVKRLDWDTWHGAVKRLDVRAILWEVEEDAILYTGQRLQRNVSSLNVEVFSSKKASKRLGRDRGGKGFRLGSRKSDVCCVVYKNTSEPAAQEYRFQGQALINAVRNVHEQFGHKSSVLDLWAALQNDFVRRGNRRLERGLDEAGIGTYWPLFDHKGAEDYEGLQKSFTTYAAQLDQEEHAAGRWVDDPSDPDDVMFLPSDEDVA